MTKLMLAADRTFRSLRIRNYRLYFFGQVVSFTGTWVQSVAQMWLVLELTGSGVALGVVTALQFLPMLLFGIWGGVVADRFDKRRVLMWTQSAGAALAFALAVLSLTDVLTLWMIYGFALALGFVTVIDNPTRQSFAVEMVGPEDLSNAVGLNSTIFTSTAHVGAGSGCDPDRGLRSDGLFLHQRRVIRRRHRFAVRDASRRATSKRARPTL